MILYQAPLDVSSDVIQLFVSISITPLCCVSLLTKVVWQFENCYKSVKGAKCQLKSSELLADLLPTFICRSCDADLSRLALREGASRDLAETGKETKETLYPQLIHSSPKELTCLVSNRFRNLKLCFTGCCN